jgi:glycosyltransferase involved in cell wall biosynthesis
MDEAGRRLRILTWHVHGNYLYYLTQTPHEFYLPVGRTEHGYGGRAPGFPWPANVHEVPVEQVRDLELDCILFQSAQHYVKDQYEILSDAQRQRALVYLEHDPPQQHPTNTRHIVDDPAALLVHVTAFNELMWDSGRTPTRVIEHGVLMPEEVRYRGEFNKGLVVVNGIQRRGRRLGWDVFQRVRSSVPLDLIGMESERSGGLGEVGHEELPGFMCRYRFIFNPIRYTSLGLAVCEAMTLGIPVVGLATTEMVTAVTNDVNGYVDTDVDVLIDRMRDLLAHPEHARRLSERARTIARGRFGIGRFTKDWHCVLTEAVQHAEVRRTDSWTPHEMGATA